MRKGNDPQFLHNIDGSLLAVNLGSDFTAEHEMGIAPIRKMFAIPSSDKDWGIKRRKITGFPSGAHAFGWAKGAMPKSEGIYSCDTWDGKAPDFSKDSELRTYSTQTLAGAWDEKSFGVFSSNPTEIGHLHEIYNAFKAKNVVIFLGGRNGWIGNSGLVLAIASRLPDEFTQKWYDADKEAYGIEKDVKKSGIRELLEKAGKRYFALSRAHYDKDGKLSFWLNPMEQDRNNFGYFTLDQLKEWAEGKGPIPKTK